MTDLDVLVVAGTRVDHAVRVPLLPLEVRDSMTVPPIQSVAGHTGTGVALGCVALGLRTALVDVIGDDLEGRLVQDRFACRGRTGDRHAPEWRAAGRQPRHARRNADVAL